MEVLQKNKSVGSIQRMICCWPKTLGDERKPCKVSKLQRQGLVPMLISQAHLPTNGWRSSIDPISECLKKTTKSRLFALKK